MTEGPQSTAGPQARDVDGPFVVGVGASAGGIQALKTFFTHVPADSGAAYVVILHLSPDHDSRLAEVLQLVARIPVTQVTQRVTMEADHVYVVPPNKVLALDRHSIVVSEISRIEQRRAPVDLFFRSLADAQGARAVCVILSGTGPNGSVGLKRVEEYGGLVIAQDPLEAEHSDMPRNSIATGLVDFVLPAADMPERIRMFHERLRPDADDPAASSLAAPDPDAMRDILTLLRIRTGHDFSNYKPGTVRRRVERRTHVLGLPSVAAYARTIRETPDEAVALMKELLISVTHFFRDDVAFDRLATIVIPQLFSNRGTQDQLRVWVPACATGEEAYSVAMLLAEHAITVADQPAIQVFASDLDEHAIAVARDALYSDAEVADVSDERLQRFFTRETRGFRVRRDLREMVLFAHHNIIKDPPFSHIDLISCRNLLIYLNRSVQERIIETFHFALRPGRFLFLGTSEAPDSTTDLFTVVDKSAHIYESRPVASRVLLPAVDHLVPAPRPARQAELRSSERISPGELHQRLLETYGPPSVVITDEFNVVHLSESVGRYLQVGGGEPTREILKMVQPELRADLRSALHQAVRQRAIVTIRSHAPAGMEGKALDITVHPALRESDPARGYMLITFDQQGAEPVAQSGDTPTPVTIADPIALHLEEELARAKQQLRATVEQYETQVEEAKASNEELQAMNEELRSAAEELETSKEELQSVNEELTTVNQELKIKIEEVGLANNDFQNLINSSDIGTIFLDRDSRVKLSTPAANQIFNLLRTDIGRPLSDITSHLLYENLHVDVRQVLDDLQTVEREVQTRDGRWSIVRIRPYRTTDNRIDGVVITFHDITQRRRAEDRLRQGEERLRLLIDGAVDYAIFTMSMDGVIDSWNSGAERLFGYRADEIVQQNVEILFTAEDRAGGAPAAELRTAYEKGRASDERFHVRKDGTRFYCSGTTMRLGEGLGYAKIARDLSAQQQAAEALQVVQADFDSRLKEHTGRLEAEVLAREEAHGHVTHLLRLIVTAQEAERRRIARDLHDQLGQLVTALRLHLQRHREQAGGTSTGDDLERAMQVADRLDGSLDQLAWELRPAVLDDLGLAAALPRFVEEWSNHYDITAEYRSERFVAGDLGREAEVAFYRVAQEALNNVLKHAHASRVDVMLETRDGSVLLVIEDDGVGFDDADRTSRDKGVGLIGMRERASLIGATLQIESKAGEGTSVFLRCATSGEARATPV